MNLVLVGLGSNSKMRQTIFEALQLMDQVCDVKVMTHLYQNKTLGASEEIFPYYVNTVAFVETTSGLEAFQAELKGIEQQLGRSRDSAECVIDLDLLAFNFYKGQLGKHLLPRISLAEPYYFKCLQPWMLASSSEKFSEDALWIHLDWSEFLVWIDQPEGKAQASRFIELVVSV